ncbi:MAG: protease inhibitor I42 family protein [Candidatus Limnocylindrales bacterium]
MSARSVFGARAVAVASLASALALAGCSSSAAIDPAAAGAASGAASAALIAPSPAATSAVVPAVADVPTAASQLTVTCDEFAKQPKGSATVHLKSGDVLAVTLCTNASTGFSWGSPVIAGSAMSVSGTTTAGTPASDTAAGATVPPLGAAPAASSGTNSATAVEQGPSNAVGAASTTTFLLKADHAGTATVSLSYSRPWAGGEKDVWTYTIQAAID